MPYRKDHIDPYFWQSPTVHMASRSSGGMIVTVCARRVPAKERHIRTTKHADRVTCKCCLSVLEAEA